ncbi:MAG: monovalent cation/H+ antiporter subunit D family protein [Hyphomicrobiaceae bacterium]
MTGLTHQLPVLQVVVPLFGAILTAFLRRGTIAWFITSLVCFAAFANAVALTHAVYATAEPISYVMGPWSVPFGIEYRVDRLNVFVLLLVTAVGAVAMPFARKSVASEIDSHQQAWFYTMYLLCLAGLLGITVTGDAFNVFVFLEISSLSTYVLIALGRNRRALLAAYQYLIVGTIGATLYVIGIGLLYLVTGSLNLADISSRLGDASVAFSRPVIAAFAFIAVGVSLKLALFPLHVWLPNAYAYAPSIATILLAGTATKVAVYLLIRFFYSIFGSALPFTNLPIVEVMLVLSVAAMVLASLSAAFEADAKRMLAYSSVAQIGYMTLGISLANQSGLTGGIVHMLNHGIMKAALFMALAAVAYRWALSDAGQRSKSIRIADLAGVGRQMPLTMAVFVIAGLGLIGVPGTAGFISKWYLVVGAIEAGLWPLAFVIVASSLIAVVYVGRAVEAAYFREPPAGKDVVRDPPLSMLAPLLVLGAATIYFGIETSWTAGLARDAAAMLLGGLKP